MDYISTVVSVLLGLLLLSATIAVCARMLSWGLSEWLLYRLAIQEQRIEHGHADSDGARVRARQRTAARAGEHLEPLSDPARPYPDPAPYVPSRPVAARGSSMPLPASRAVPASSAAGHHLPDLIHWQDV